MKTAARLVDSGSGDVQHFLVEAPVAMRNVSADLGAMPVCYMDPKLKFNHREYRYFTDRLWGLGFLRLTRRPSEIVGISSCTRKMGASV